MTDEFWYPHGTFPKLLTQIDDVVNSLVDLVQADCKSPFWSDSMFFEVLDVTNLLVNLHEHGHMDTWICLQSVIVHNPINPVSTAPSFWRATCMSRPNSPGYGGFHSHGASPKWMAYFMEEIHWKIWWFAEYGFPYFRKPAYHFQIPQVYIVASIRHSMSYISTMYPHISSLLPRLWGDTCGSGTWPGQQKKQALHECLVMVIVGDIRWCPSSLAKLVQISPISLCFIGDISIANGDLWSIYNCGCTTLHDITIVNNTWGDISVCARTWHNCRSYNSKLGKFRRENEDKPVKLGIAVKFRWGFHGSTNQKVGCKML